MTRSAILPNSRLPRLALVALLSFLILVSGALTPIGASADEEPYAKLKSLAREKADLLTREYGVDSLVYTVLSNGEIIASGSSGQFSKTEPLPIKDNTMYGIGSTSKVFVATSIMLLVDRGLVSLDRPVTHYIPEFRMADERYKKITVRMLLNHSSGLMGSVYSRGFNFTERNYDYQSHLMIELTGQKLKADPGAFSVYCNDGFSLAEIVVERASGLSYKDFLSKNIEIPLGLNNTKTPDDEFDRNRLARTYMSGFETPTEVISLLGTGGLYSNAEDLCRFGEIFMDKPGNAAADKLLSETSRLGMNDKEYLKGIWPRQENSCMGFGLGWDSVDSYPFNLYGIQALNKGGDTLLYHSSLTVLPGTNMAAAVVMSGGASMLGLFMNQELLLEALLAEGKIDSIKPDVKVEEPIVSAMLESLLSYSGIYASSDRVDSIQIEKDGSLTCIILTLPDEPSEKYIYTGTGKFVSIDGIKKLTFVEETNGLMYTRIEQLIQEPGLGQTITTVYGAQKADPNPIASRAQEAWNLRAGTEYYLVNEMPVSQTYLMPSNSIYRLSTNKNLPGYISHFRIIDETHATSEVQVPIMSGRDSILLRAGEQNGKEYLFLSGLIYQNKNSIKNIHANGRGICTIQPDGYSRWYTVNKSDAGKTMMVNLPEGGAFAVYAGDTCVYYSTISGNQPVILPENGMVVFIGNRPGIVFEIYVAPFK